MRLLFVCWFGSYVLIGIAGHFLFSKDDVETETPLPLDQRQEAFLKVLRASEKAIKWIGNKTAESLNKLLDINNQSSQLAGQPVSESTLAAKKRQFLSWLQKTVKEKFQYNNTVHADLDSSESSEESEEPLIIAHRTKDHGFSWGPPRTNYSPKAEDSLANTSTSSAGLMQTAGHHLQSVFSFLVQSTKALTGKGKNLLSQGFHKVFSYQAVTKDLKSIEKNNAASNNAFACSDVMRPVCAIDEAKRFTIFQNECKMILYNYEHGTNFSVQDNDVCMDLFARYPDLFCKIPTL